MAFSGGMLNMKDGVSSMYGEIINAVMEDSRARFHLEGLDDSVLNELAQMWKEKLALQGVETRAGNVMQQYHGGGGAGMVKYEDYSAMPAMPSSLPMGGALPQTDGAAEGVEEAAGTGVPPGEFAMRQPRKGDLVSLGITYTPDGAEVSSLTIEQVDGGGSGPAKKRKGEDGEACADEDDDDLGDIDEESLGSDDDDDEEELYTNNLIFCQWDKVAKTKGKWKAHLKDGLVHLELSNGMTRDIAFKTTLADLNWSK